LLAVQIVFEEFLDNVFELDHSHLHLAELRFKSQWRHEIYGTLKYL
jgi:hypothetical protein